MLSIFKKKKAVKSKLTKLKKAKAGLPKSLMSSVKKASSSALKGGTYEKVSKKFDKKALLKKKLGAF